MPPYKTITLHCQLTRGPFSSENIIRIPGPGGGTFSVGAHPDYCFSEKQEPIPIDQLRRGEWVKGLVMARLVKEQADGTLLVNVPDGSMLVVAPEVVGPSPRE
jgi:hypothetical protein